jgi:hypothetical protein
MLVSIGVTLCAEGVLLVPLSKNTISYKNRIYNHETILVQVNDKYKCNEYLNFTILKKNKYFAKHFIDKNKPICLKDVYVPKINKVNFKFGNLEIEKEAELVKETKSYIKIKNLDGTIEKIYIDGRK